MRVDWSAGALADIEAIAERAPRSAGRVFEAVGWLVTSPFPAMFRELAERPGEHVLPVPPFAVFYVVEHGTLTVARVHDSRRWADAGDTLDDALPNHHPLPSQQVTLWAAYADAWATWDAGSDAAAWERAVADGLTLTSADSAG